jgi:hypothetical protein
MLAAFCPLAHTTESCWLSITYLIGRRIPHELFKDGELLGASDVAGPRADTFLQAARFRAHHQLNKKQFFKNKIVI